MAHRSRTKRGCAVIPTADSTCGSTTARSVSEDPWGNRTNRSPAAHGGLSGRRFTIQPLLDASLPDDTRMTVQVVTSAQSAARDRAVIDGGVPSRALMQR